MKQDQLAYVCANTDEEARIKAALGLASAEWVEDKVTARCTVWGKPDVINVALLQFCQAYGQQFEIIRYVRGDNWLQRHQNDDAVTNTMLSHVGFHLDIGEEFPAMKGCALAQEAHTISHTNDYLITGAAAGRRYHYKIFELSPGNYVKYIRRIERAK
jgi:hypothetical protein